MDFVSVIIIHKKTMENRLDMNMNYDRLMEAYQRGIFGWYPLSLKSKILVIQNGKALSNLFPSGCQTRFVSIGEALETSNLDIIEERFDYIYLISALEHAHDPVAFLGRIKKLLLPEGVLLAACENRLGMKYLCGEKDPYTDSVFDGINNYRDKKQQERCYSKEELAAVFEQAGFSRQKFYAVFPGIQYPELILAEDYSGNENIAFRYIPLYQSPETIIAREEELCAAFARSGIIHDFANAYFIECPQDGEAMPIRQVSISANRGLDHASITTLYKDHAEKKPLFPNGTGVKTLAKNLEYLREKGLPVVDGYMQGSTYIMPFLPGQTGDVYLRNLLNKDHEQFIQEMDRFRELIMASSGLRKGEKSDVELSEGFCDLVPLNTIYNDGTFVIIDQEYTMSHCSVDYIIFRFINVVYGDNEINSDLPKEFFYQRYGLQDKLDVLMLKDVDFNNQIKNRDFLEVFNDNHMRSDAVMLHNQELLNDNEFYEQYMENCFDDIEDKKIYVCGSDETAEEFVKRYKDKLNICKVIDNDRTKWGKELGGYEVSPIDAIIGEQEAYKVIICSKQYKALLKQILRMQVWYVGIFDPEREYEIAALQVTEAEKQYMESCFEGVEDKKIYVCGSDETAEEFVKRYKDKLNICKVIDNDRTKWGKELGGYEVSPIDAIIGEQEAYKVIICSKQYKALLKQIQRMQVWYVGIFDPEREYEIAALQVTEAEKQYMESCFEGVEDKKIYVCGSDETAEEFVKRYKDKLNICKVIDNDRTKWGKELGGYEVSPIDAIVGEQEAYKVIICSKQYKALLKQIQRMQVWYVGIFDPEREYEIAALQVTEAEKQYMESCFEGVEDKKIYVCGSDETAEEFVKRYKDKLNICKVIDNDRTKWGKELGGYEVSPIDAIVGEQEAYKVIICSKQYKALLKQIQRMQVWYVGIFDPEREYKVPNINIQTDKTTKYHIGYCAGVYDLFHIGHINIFKKAKEHCDYLIVGVVSDEAVRANKHCEPFIPFEERIEMVRSCKYVDEAVKIPLEAATVWDAYQLYHFDVQFSGSDYENDPGWLEAQKYLREHGSEMLFFPYTLSTSSTKIKSLIEKGLLE